MAKVVTAKVKLQCPGGQATPAPPVGPALGQRQRRARAGTDRGGEPAPLLAVRCEGVDQSVPVGRLGGV